MKFIKCVLSTGIDTERKSCSVSIVTDCETGEYIILNNRDRNPSETLPEWIQNNLTGPRQWFWVNLREVRRLSVHARNTDKPLGRKIFNQWRKANEA